MLWLAVAVGYLVYGIIVIVVSVAIVCDRGTK